MGDFSLCDNEDIGMSAPRTTLSLSNSLKLFFAKYFWFSGEPPRNGSFLVQDESGRVYFEWRMADAPGRRSILYWKRANAPLQPPAEYLSYNRKARLEEGQNVPFVRDFY